MIRPKHSREILRFGSYNIFRSLLGEGWYFRLRIRVSAYPLHNILLRSLLGEGWYFRLRIRVSAYPLHNIPRSLLGEEWYFRLRIRVSAYPLHNILLRSLLGEGCYFRLRIRVSSLFRGAASKWRGILQLLHDLFSNKNCHDFERNLNHFD